MADQWHDAVLAECMRVESCYYADDPVRTIKELIDWHTKEGVKAGVQQEKDAAEYWRTH